MVAPGCTPVARPFATVKSLDGGEKSLPVAGLQHFSGVYDDLTIPAFLDRRAEANRACAQCGAGWPRDLPTIAVTAKNGMTVYVHEHGCLGFWKQENGTGVRS